jgi:plasmid stability protein
MSKMIQIRNVPDDVHRTLKARAAKQGMTLSDYLKQELAHIAELPAVEEVLERAKHREPGNIDAETIVELIRATRDA